MGQTLSNGIYLPDEGERNSYSGLEANWRTLDALILTINGKAAPNVANTWTAAQTFTAGIAGDLTGNVTGNVTGNLTGTASKAIADEDGTSIKSGYVNVAGNQTVTGDKSFTGSNTFNNILPNATNTYALGSSSYQWGSVHAQTYYYNGTQWGLDKENVWTGSNRFRNFGVQSANTIDITQSTYTNSLNCGGIGFSDAVNRFWGDIELNVKTDATSEMVFNLSNWKTNGAQGVTALRFRYDKTLTTVDFFGADKVVNLGTSTNKWKTLNGINPGALSLPNGNAQDTSWIGDLTIKDGSDYNLKTFTLNGWITINIPNTAGNLVVVNNGCGQIVTNEANGITGNNCAVFIPVVANVQISILLVLQTGESVKTAIFVPCLGNV